MSGLSTAIDVAAEYAAHLHRQDGIPKGRAVSIAAAAVVRSIRTKPSKFVTQRKSTGSGLGMATDVLIGAGSVLSAIGWVKNLVTGG